MTQSLIGQRLCRAYAKTASRLGVRGRQYRPSSGMRPMGVLHARPMLAFDADAGFSFRRPLSWGRVTEYVLTDRLEDTRIGDILAVEDRVCFVASLEALRPPSCIVCTHVVTIRATPAEETPVLMECPAALLLSGRGDASGSPLPGALQPAAFRMFLPLLPGVRLFPYMTVSDDRGARYTLDGVEPSPFGTRCTMSLHQI